MATKKKAVIPRAPAKRKPAKRRAGGSAHLYRYTSAIALLALVRMLKRLPDLNGVNPESLIEAPHAERILEALDRWTLAARRGQAMTLDDAFGLKVRGVRGGWKHPVLEYGKAVRDNYYLLELARLEGLGLVPKQADEAVAGRWPADSAAASRLPPPPWAVEFPTIPPLAEASIVSEVRRPHFRPGKWIFDESLAQTTIADCKAQAAAWNDHDRRAYLDRYPRLSLPRRFRAD